MPLKVRVPRIAEDRRPIIGKTISEGQKQRKCLGDVSNIPSNVTRKVADLKIATGARQRIVDTNKPAPSSIKPRTAIPKLVPQENVIKKQEVVEKREPVKKEIIEDIDKQFSGNVFLVSEYARDVYMYLMRLEVKFPICQWPLPGSKITEGMRTILVDWLVDVHLEFNLLQETIHTSVAILDRFLQVNNNLEKDIFQLVGICSLFLASKYEEILPPSMCDFIYLCKNAYDRKEMLEMEKKMLSSLGYDLGRPVTVVFLRRYNMAAKADKLQHCFSKYFIDSVLLDSHFSHVRPSLVAAAAAFMAMCIIKKNCDPSFWTSTMVHYSSYSFMDVKPVAVEMSTSIINSYKSKYDSVRRKYAQSSFLAVSMKTQALLGILKNIANLASE